MPRTHMSVKRSHFILFTLILTAMLVHAQAHRVLAVGCSAPSFNISAIDFSATGVTSIIADDFNADGKVDLAAIVFGPTTGGYKPLIMLGDGMGGFTSSYPTGGTGLGVALATGDFSRDGKLDLVVVGGNRVQTYPGDGLGGFGTPDIFAARSQQMNSVSVADFNDDGNPDIVVTNQQNPSALEILLGNGAGTFVTSPNTIPLNSFPQDTAVGDFNRDGNIDIAVATYGNPPALITSKVTILFGDGSGSFPGGSLSYDVANGQARTIDVGDFNGDGIADLAVAKYASMTTGQLALMYGTGAGTFSGDGSFASGNGPAFIAHKDFNLDRQLDLVVANYNHGGVSFHLGNQINGYPGSIINFPLSAPKPLPVAIGDFNGDARPDLVVGNFEATSPTLTLMLNACAAPLSSFADFDGDGRADISVFRPSSGVWYVSNSSNGSFQGQAWGVSTDKPVPADYDGDGRTDFAVYRPNEGNWYVLQSSNNLFRAQSWGVATDVPVPGDYDGDGKSDFAVYRPQSGTWFIIQSTNGAARIRQWGVSTDVVVPGDYDGDNQTDLAVFRPSSGKWYVLQSSNNIMLDPLFGASGDVPVPADYDGDARTDMAVFHHGAWSVAQSLSRVIRSVQWGSNADIPAPTDYDGDGRADLAVFRPSAGAWYILQSSNGAIRAQQFGLSQDVPVPSAVIPQ